MKKHYTAVLLAVILCLSLAACGSAEPSGAGQTANVLQSSDGRYEITVPMGWEDVTSEAGGRVLLSIQKNSVDYMAMTAENSALELRDYTAKVTSELEKSIVTDGKVTAGEPSAFSIPAGEGYKTVISNKVDDAEICSNIYCIRIEDAYIQVNCVYVNSIQPEMSREYDEIVRTLRPAKQGQSIQ